LVVVANVTDTSGTQSVAQTGTRIGTNVSPNAGKQNILYSLMQSTNCGIQRDNIGNVIVSVTASSVVGH